MTKQNTLYKPSEWTYRCIMGQLEYNYDTKTFTLPAKLFREFEPDSLLTFSTRYAAHEFIYNQMIKEGL